MPLIKSINELFNHAINCLNCGAQVGDIFYKMHPINSGTSRFGFHCSCGMRNRITYASTATLSSGNNSFSQRLLLKEFAKTFEYAEGKTNYYGGIANFNKISLAGFVIYQKFMRLANFE